MLLILLQITCSLIYTIHSLNSRDEELSRIKHYELIEINTNLFKTEKIIEFNVFNQYYKVKLERNEHIIPSQIRHTSIDINILPKEHHYFTFTESCHYFGKVINTNEPSKVALSLCPKRGIRGRIHAFNQTILIKPSAHYFDFDNSVTNGHSINDQVLVYKISHFDITDVGTPNGIQIDENDKFKKQWITKTNKNENENENHTKNELEPNRRRLYSSSSPAVTEILIINGPERTQRYQTDYGDRWYSALYADLADVMNQVSGDYEGTNWGSYVGGAGSIVIKWVELEVIFSFTDEYRTLAPNFYTTQCMTTYADCAVNGRTWLTTIQNWLHQYKDLASFDNVQLISDITFSPNIAGNGNIQQVCKGSTSVSDIYEGWGLDYVVKTLAHELGHNFGMAHDGDVGCDSDRYIMGGGYNDFSSCSVNSLQNYFAANNGLTCLGTPSNAGTRAVSSNYNGNEAPPPTNSNAPQPTPPPSSGSGGDDDGDWSCFGMRNIGGVSGFNGNWAQDGMFNSKRAYYLNGYYLYYHATYKWWLISLSKGSTQVKGYCKQEQLNTCNGNFRALTSTGWVDETTCNIYNCGDTAPSPTPPPVNAPTPPPVNAPTSPPFPCTNYDCLRITSMHLDSDGNSYNGDWSPAGCHNGQSYYLLNGAHDRVLCYSSYNMWMIAEGLCPTGRTIAYSPNRGAEQIISTQNNWQVLGAGASGGWGLDTGVTLVPCGGIPVRFTDCLSPNEYNNNVCVYSKHGLWKGERNFEVHPSLCSKGKPVYRYTIYNETENVNEDESPVNETITYNNIFRVYYLHFYEELIYSDGTDTIGKWIITQDEITIKALATCEKDNLLECTENTWIVDDLHELDENAKDAMIDKIIDDHMTITNNECETTKETQPTTSNNKIIIIIVIGVGVVIMIGCIIGCCVWYKREKTNLKNTAQRVADGDTVKLDESDEGGDEYDDATGARHETQMIEVNVEMEVDDDEMDEVDSPLNPTITYN